MSVPIAPLVGDDARRLDVVRAGRSGLDSVDVRGDGRSLAVAFFGPLPDGLTRAHVRITGGERVTAIGVTSVSVTFDGPEAQGLLLVRLDRVGDASTYRLHVVDVAAVDPLYAALPFTFDRSRVRLTDCAPDAAAGAVPASAPHIDYLAKDYATFRQLLLDRAALIVPSWNERHVPDLSVTLIELLAYVGDQLSYYQDAVATEAYLGTARKRISVRRHARLIDYRMHEGCNARTWISLSATADVGPIDAQDIVFSTARSATGEAEYFEPLVSGSIHVYAAHGPIRLYGWGSRSSALPMGATQATLRDAWEDGADGGEPVRVLRRLATGAYVLFETRREQTGAAPDPGLRHVVRLTHVQRGIDPLYDVPVVAIGWAADDRLPFALAVSLPDPADPTGPPIEPSVAWANLVPVDHGRSATVDERLPDVPREPTAAPYRPKLAQPQLTFAEPVRSDTAAHWGRRDVRAARAAITHLVSEDLDGRRRPWTPVADLFASGPDDAHVVVEVDDDERAVLRFGDGVNGRLPPAGARMRVRYRTGNGIAGNVGAETIVNVAWSGAADAAGVLWARNPLPALGGAAPEPIDDVRALGPSALRTDDERAIAPDDYARIARSDPRLQGAAAEFRWTGARTLVRVALDPLGSEELDAALRADVAARLERVRRIGHDVDVIAATYVPLELALEVVVDPAFERGAVRTALTAAFGSTQGADGSRGFFHPDALALGAGIAQSRIVARAMAVAGVRDVAVRRLARRFAPVSPHVPAVLTIGPLEIAQLDGDPARPERGVFDLHVRGGR